MPKVNRVTDRAHTIVSFDLNQRDFMLFVEELKKSKFFPNLIGIEVKRPNYGNPVLGLGALLLQDFSNKVEEVAPVERDEETETCEFASDLSDVDETPDSEGGTTNDC